MNAPSVGIFLILLAADAGHDPIDAAVAEARANPFFGNGIHEIFRLPSDARDSQIIAAAYPTLNVPEKQSKYWILEERGVQLTTQPARAVLLRTGDKDIVVFLQYSQLGWSIDWLEE
jgi:hypothetical protein